MKRRVLDVEVVPGYDSNPEKLKFDWELTHFSEKRIIIQLYFEDAVYVSQNEVPDKLKVIFYDRKMFVSKQNMAIALPISDNRR